MKRPIFALLLTTLPFSTHADRDGERAALARLIHEIEALTPIVREAEMQADSGARIRFQYGWLQLDLDRIKLGIREHLDAPRAEPRTFPPLKGDYRR
ncbi:MAG: RAQPRD family integrative conjugative element protein [Gammaproteobacteria bacterium]|nr:RAQPRD family integrative conjugative element protein [Gammaproteobacteria bacterium]